MPLAQLNTIRATGRRGVVYTIGLAVTAVAICQHRAGPDWSIAYPFAEGN